MRKEHQAMIDYILKTFPNKEGVRTKWFGKHKCVAMDSENIWIKYYDTYVLRYAHWGRGMLYLDFGEDKFATNSTACLMKDMVEGLFGFEWLPRWGGVVDEYGNHWIFDDNCEIEINNVVLSNYRINNESKSRGKKI